VRLTLVNGEPGREPCPARAGTRRAAEGREIPTLETPPEEARYLRAALAAAQVARGFLAWMEVAAERLSPQRAAGLAAETERLHGAGLRAARAALDAAPAPAEIAPFAARLAEGFDHVERAFGLFTSAPDAFPDQRIAHVLGALHEVARAQETFYLLRRPLEPFRDFWQLPGTVDVDGPPSVVHVSAGGHHGGFALYVPESYAPDRPWPLIVALHGGSGNGRDFLWTWVREAKSLGYLLLAPTAAGDTWDEPDDRGLLEILTWLDARYGLDRGRILLTGLSDGATFTLLYGLAHPDVYRALSPLCGVLHPANEAIGNLERARGVPIYLVHGEEDFLFPVALARYARDRLLAAGAALEYRELPELSHTYPRSENVRILEWFSALPARA
jgi:phospholipase/carboxylesterase